MRNMNNQTLNNYPSAKLRLIYVTLVSLGPLIFLRIKIAAKIEILLE